MFSGRWLGECPPHPAECNCASLSHMSCNRTQHENKLVFPTKFFSSILWQHQRVSSLVPSITVLLSTTGGVHQVLLSCISFLQWVNSRSWMTWFINNNNNNNKPNIYGTPTMWINQAHYLIYDEKPEVQTLCISHSWQMLELRFESRSFILHRIIWRPKTMSYSTSTNQHRVYHA